MLPYSTTKHGYDPYIDMEQFWCMVDDYEPFNASEPPRTYTTEFQFNTYWSYKYLTQS